jgi:hypothetical protein
MSDVAGPASSQLGIERCSGQGEGGRVAGPGRQRDNFLKPITVNLLNKREVANDVCRWQDCQLHVLSAADVHCWLFERLQLATCQARLYE